MKSIKFICIVFLSVFVYHHTKAQCTGGSSGGAITPGLAWQSVNTTNLNGGTYRTFNATAGQTYYFSFCTVDGGASAFDTQISILDNTGVGMAGGYNDDFCGVQSYVAWPCVTTGTYRVLVNLYNCANQNNIGTLVYKYSAALTCPGNLGGGVTLVGALPYASGAGTTCGSGNDLTASNTIGCGSTFYLGGEDRVWVFTPASTGTVNINLASVGSWNGLMLYQGCPLNGQGGSCVAVSQSAAGSQSIVACLTGGVTYYLILDVFPSPTCNPYSNLTISAPVAVGGCALGTGVVAVPALPYASSGRTTCGKVNDQTAANTLICGNTSYLTGEDEVFVFTPVTSGNITISITSSGSYTGIMLYRGCPITSSCSVVGSTCIAFEQSSTGSKSLCANVIAGQTYYVIVDSWASPSCNPYDIVISAPATLLSGATCTNAINIASFPYSIINESTACLGNDYSNASIGSCATLYESGEDKVYKFTSTGAECISITLSGASSNSIGYQVYSGCPGVAGSTCIGSSGGANSGTLTGSVVLPLAGVYYIVIDSWAPPTNVSYNLAITSFGGGAPNDLPCNATPLILGVPLSSVNNCSGGSGEPPVPTCWVTPNVRNTVWFVVAAPASGQLRVRIIPGSLTNPQAVLYSGVCGASMLQFGCNDNATPCGNTINYSSEMLVTGLVPGQNYYIMVDGNANLTGTFSVLALDGIAPLPQLSNGQDCGTFLPVCDTTMSFGDPGFQSFGNICDFPGGGTNCLLSGERGSVWFEIPINANGFLEFSIIPKDWPGAPSTLGTDYDFALWRTMGTGAVTCAQIATGATPAACNYSFLGLTGLYSAVNLTAPPQYPGFGTAFNTRLPVVAGEKYILVVSNFSNSTSGFDIIFSNTSPVLYGANGTSSVWSGGIDVDWFKKDNWGGCPIPTCSRDAIINGGIVIQPTVTGIATCKSMLINPGAVLTIPSGQTLSVCENFTNFGVLAAATSSTVYFGNAAVNQTLNGNLTGSNGFGNVTIAKTGGMVTASQNVDMKGVFNNSTATSRFNANGRYHKVAGNFNNLGKYFPSGGTLELNGSLAQSYYSLDTLNNFQINHSGPGVTLSSMMHLGTNGSLTLTNGKLITTPLYEVIVLNRAPTAVSPGNPLSFVQGFLRRYLNNLGSYDFPVGEVSKGYERANINFAYASNPTLIDNLKSSFVPYSVLPGPLGVLDCGLTYSSNALNNGRWTFVASNSPTSGNFDVTLYNTGFTNAANGWTIMTSNGGAWSLGSGTCVVSPVTAVRRNDMNGIFEFGTAQAPSPLPVQWLEVYASALANRVKIHWSTANEVNNSGFEVQKLNPVSKGFESVAWLDGAGNSNQVNYYSFDDLDVKAEEDYFYQIKQLDFNGASTYSEVVHARLKPTISSNVQFYPNPLTVDSKLVFNLENNSSVKITIVNVMGEVVAHEDLGMLKSGNCQVNVTSHFKDVSVGLYTVSVEIDGLIERLKVLHINGK